MKERLAKNYSELHQGDLDYLVEKFKDRYHGKWYTSWSRAFYTFIGNQLVMYNYRPGSFNWRQQQGGQTNGTGQQTRATTESAAERNERLEREAEEYTRRLSGESDGDSSEGEEALTLTADDFG